MNEKNKVLTEDSFEIVEMFPVQKKITHILFDHDGTLSTIRMGWENILFEMMYHEIVGDKILDKVRKQKMRDEINAFIDRTTGSRTIEQMEGLIKLINSYEYIAHENILSRFEYKSIYLDQLKSLIEMKVCGLEKCSMTPREFMILGADKFLNQLYSLGLQLYLASGTDEDDVIREAKAMGYAKYFNGGIYGSRDSLELDIKRYVLETITAKIGKGNMNQVVVFGDGPVEIREGRKFGAIAVGVASNENQRQGIDVQKRKRLIKAGAHIIIGDYNDADKIIDLLEISKNKMDDRS